MDPNSALSPFPVPAWSGGGPTPRAGDRERSAVCSQLSTHYAAGRLGAEELDARLGAAMSAVTVLELRQLLADLPAPAPAPAAVDRVPAPRPAWGLLEVLALMVVIGALGVAGLAVLGLASVGQPGLLAAGFFGGLTAAAGGGALVHLLHAAARRQREAADQRPRIA